MNEGGGSIGVEMEVGGVGWAGGREELGDGREGEGFWGGTGILGVLGSAVWD